MYILGRDVHVLPSGAPARRPMWGAEEGGLVPTRDWCLNLPSLTSCGLRCAVTGSSTTAGGMWYLQVDVPVPNHVHVLLTKVCCSVSTWRS